MESQNASFDRVSESEFFNLSHVRSNSLNRLKNSKYCKSRKSICNCLNYYFSWTKPPPTCINSIIIILWNFFCWFLLINSENSVTENIIFFLRKQMRHWHNINTWFVCGCHQPGMLSTTDVDSINMLLFLIGAWRSKNHSICFRTLWSKI